MRTMDSNEHGDQGPPDRVESLLRDFFADELGMGVSRRDSSSGSDPSSAMPRIPRWWLPLTAVAAGTLLGLWLASDGTVRDPGSNSTPAQVEEYLVIKDAEFLDEEVYSTPDGAVSQSASLQWTTVSTSDPLSGSRLDVAVPQLVIIVEATNAQGKRSER